MGGGGGVGVGRGARRDAEAVAICCICCICRSCHLSRTLSYSACSARIRSVVFGKLRKCASCRARSRMPSILVRRSASRVVSNLSRSGRDSAIDVEKSSGAGAVCAVVWVTCCAGWGGASCDGWEGEGGGVEGLGCRSAASGWSAVSPGTGVGSARSGWCAWCGVGVAGVGGSVSHVLSQPVGGNSWAAAAAAAICSVLSVAWCGARSGGTMVAIMSFGSVDAGEPW